MNEIIYILNYLGIKYRATAYFIFLKESYCPHPVWSAAWMSAGEYDSWCSVLLKRLSHDQT